jgi:hypothetical protein
MKIVISSNRSRIALAILLLFAAIACESYARSGVVELTPDDPRFLEVWIQDLPKTDEIGVLLVVRRPIETRIVTLVYGDLDKPHLQANLAEWSGSEAFLAGYFGATASNRGTLLVAANLGDAPKFQFSVRRSDAQNISVRFSKSGFTRPEGVTYLMHLKKFLGLTKNATNR